jgi:hypothetical protein
MSDTTYSVTSKLRLAVFLAATVVMLQGVDARADFAGFSGLDITGSVDYNTGNAYADGTSSIGGSFSTTEGGAITTSTFSNSGVTGANPLSGTLSSVGDGFGISAASAAGSYQSAESESGVGIMELLLDIDNTSASTTYLVTLGLAWDNSANSSGSDAYLDSEFTLDDPTGEIFFTNLVSDTRKTGGLMADSGTESFTISLDPGDTWLFVGELDMEGGAYLAGSTYAGSFSGALTVTDVEAVVVPVPGALLLGSIGLGYAGCLLRRRKDRN